MMASLYHPVPESPAARQYLEPTMSAGQKNEYRISYSPEQDLYLMQTKVHPVISKALRSHMPVYIKNKFRQAILCI